MASFPKQSVLIRHDLLQTSLISPNFWNMLHFTRTLARAALSLSVLFPITYPTQAQKMRVVAEVVNLDYFKTENEALGEPSPNENRVVFMGNSITQGWLTYHPEFFEENAYINRGISGQTTAQMVLRFRTDVVQLRPRVVVILAGTNDLAQNTGYMPIGAIADNIKTMAELAEYHGIRVVIASVLPAIDFPWRRGLEPAPKIEELNRQLKAYAQEKGHVYLDYHSALADDNGGLKVPDYTSASDLVHPNSAGYAVMEPLVQAAIEQALR